MLDHRASYYNHSLGGFTRRSVPFRQFQMSFGEELVESAPGDFYWGCAADGSGLNRLGQILMEVREVLRAEAEP